MRTRSLLVISVAIFFTSKASLPAQSKTKPKEVIPHAQSVMPGPPLSPQLAIKKMVVPPGFSVELVASEPDIINPVAMTIDERGRFWITESIEYPRRSAGPGKDRVKVLDSTKGDGVYDKITTVIDGLNIPSGIAVGHGGVWVANSPDILYYPFVDRENLRLAKPQMVVTGFGRDDTHELPNSLTWGPDGWLYGLNGVFNRSRVKSNNGKTYNFTCALFRIHPRTKEFQIFCEGTSNPWGLAFNENGDAFVSACVIDHLWHLVETGYYHRQGGPYPPFTWKIESIVKHKHQKAAYCGLTWFDSDAYPPEYREKLYMGNIHGGAINCDMLTKDGSTYFGKPGLLPSPPVLRGRGAGGEGAGLAGASRPAWRLARPRAGAQPHRPPRAGLAGASSPSPLTPLPLSTGGEGNGLPADSGKGVKGEAKLGQGVGEGSNFLIANDAWFMPVVQKTGPDGCLYILDWYDRYHCYQDANRDPAGIDRLRGRLYRVVYKDYKPAGKFDLGKESDDELVKRLSIPNVYARETAQRLLTERISDMVRAQLSGAANADSIREITTNLHKLVFEDQNSGKARLHALWVLIGSNHLYSPQFEKLLNHHETVLRAWGVRALGNNLEYLSNHKIPEFRQFVMAPWATVHSKRVASLAKDGSFDVQLQVAIAACKLKGVESIPVLLDVLNYCGNDKLIPHIVWQNLHPLLEEKSGEFLAHLAKIDLEKSPNVVAMLPRVVDRILGTKQQNPDAIVSLVNLLGGTKENFHVCAQVLAALEAKVQSGELRGEQLQSLKHKLLPVMHKLEQNLDDHFGLGLRFQIAYLGATLKDEQGVQATRRILEISGLPAFHRIKALEALIAAGDTAVLDRVLDMVKKAESTTAFRGQAIAALGKLDSPKVAEVLLGAYTKLEPDVQPKAIDLLTQRSVWSKTLLGEIAAKKLPPSVLNVNQVRKLLASKDADLVKQVTKVWGTVRTDRNPQREQLVAEMRDLLKTTPGDPKAGRLHYNKICAQCHKMYGEGQDVGPDITSNGRSDFEQLLSNVFDPSLVIGAGYTATTVVTNNGQSLAGLVVEESPQRIVLKTQGGKIETIPRDNIDQVLRSKLSYMPEDVEKQLRPQEIADLFAYLCLDRPPEDPNARKIPGTPR